MGRRILALCALIGVVGWCVAVAPASPLFCAIDWTGAFKHIDAAVGEVPPSRHDLPWHSQALAMSPSGTCYLGHDDELYAINVQNGDITLLHDMGWETGEFIRGLACSASGDLYVLSGQYEGHLRRVDPATWQSTTLGTIDLLQGLAFSPAGVLYASTVGTEGSEIFTIDLDDLERHPIGVATGLDVSQSLEFTPDGRLFAVGWDFAELDPTDASAIGPVWEMSTQWRGLALVPEPGAAALLVLAFVAAARRRR